MTDQRAYQRRSYDGHYRKRLSAVEEQLEHPLFRSFYDRLARRVLELGLAGPTDQDRSAVRVYEPGCGEGLLAAALQRTAAERQVVLAYTGADLSPGALELTRRTVHGELLVGDAIEVSTSLPPASQDLIVVKNLLHHLDEPDALLRQAARVLAPGGRVVVVEARLGSPQIWITAGLANRRERYLFHGQRRNATALRSAGFHVLHRERFSWLPYELAFAIRPRVFRRLLSTGDPGRIQRISALDDRLSETLPWFASYVVWVAEPDVAYDATD